MEKKLALLIISGSDGGGFAMDSSGAANPTSSATSGAGGDRSEAKRLLWRMDKREQQQPQLPQPEDEDDSGAAAERKRDTRAPPLPPLIARAQERMYTWLEPQSSSAGDQAAIALVPKEVRSAPVWHGYNSIAAGTAESGSSGGGAVVVREEIQNARTRLLPPSATATAVSHEFWRAVHSTSSATYGGRSESSRGTRHSILRFGSSKLPRSANDRSKKSPSVEFRLHQEDRRKHAGSETPSPSRLEIGRETPRRLTDEEKEELYRVRPDLEIGPSPFFQEQMEELNRRNQRRVVFAMFGGMVSVVLLLVFYALLARG